MYLGWEVPTQQPPNSFVSVQIRFGWNVDVDMESPLIPARDVCPTEVLLAFRKTNRPRKNVPHQNEIKKKYVFGLKGNQWFS